MPAVKVAGESDSFADAGLLLSTPTDDFRIEKNSANVIFALHPALMADKLDFLFEQGEFLGGHCSLLLAL